MRKLWNRGTAVVLAAVMCAAALSGCSKKAEAKPVYTFNGKAVDADLTNFVMRYQQAGFDQSYGSMLSQYYGQSVWGLDVTGTGEIYESTFKTQIGDMLQRLLLAEEHAADYGVELTEDDRAAISAAATKFIADNDPEALASMSASQEVVERALELFTIRAKAEKEMSADVDTEVSDEEAAQTTISWIEYTPMTESESESETELYGTEAETEGRTTAMTEAEAAAEAAMMTEGETSPVETEEADKTGSAAETEDAETEAAVQTEAETEAAAAETEADAPAESEAESETEDPAMAAAREKYLAMAQAQLDRILSGEEDFDTAVEAADADETAGIYTSSATFGADDTYPAAEIMEAVKGLEDGAVVDHLVESAGSWYILRMDDAFDEEATEDKKEEIIDGRRQEMIDAAYEGWMGSETWAVDAEALAAISLAQVVYQAPERPETEGDLDVEIETESEEISAETEADALTTVQTEADAEAAETEPEFGAQTEADAAAETEAE